MRCLLFRNNNFQEIGNMIKNLWIKRRHFIENNKRKKDNTPDRNHPNIIQRDTNVLSDPGPSRIKYGHIRRRAKNRSSER